MFQRISFVRSVAGCLAATTMLYPVHTHAGAWTQKPNETQLIHNFSLYSPDEAFTPGGDKINIPRFTKLEYNPYLEYGLKEGVTLGATPTLEYINQGGEKQVILNEIRLLSRFRLYQNDQTVVSVQPLVKLPGLYDKADLPSPGPKQVDAELRFLMGQTIPYAGQNHFANLEVAYRYRAGMPSDEFHADGTLGYRYSENLLVMAQWFHTQSLGSRSSSLQLSSPVDYNLDKLQLSAVMPFYAGTSLQLGGFYNVAGENTGAGGGVMAALWQKF